MKSKFTTHKGNEDIVQMAQISSQTKNLKKKNMTKKSIALLFNI